MADPPAALERDYPLARLTTIRTGGRAEYFARAGTLTELEALLRWADVQGLEVGVVGSGSNLLVADAGVAGLVLKLDKDLATIEITGERIACGGGARLPAVSARAAQAGLTGLEFGVNIPGTVGGAVRMNANAYGGELAGVLEWVQVVTASGADRLKPDQLGFRYRSSSLPPGAVVARASFTLARTRSADVKATLAEMRAKRKAAQPSGVKTFGSTFKNPDDPRAESRTAGQLLEEAGCRGLRIGGAGFSEKHANFIVNHGDATTEDVIALMAEGRRRVKERFGVVLEPEVQTLGPVSVPAEWSRA
jgi:UDP-N-acetylenolpyruvoylglucosamine reductase